MHDKPLLLSWKINIHFYQCTFAETSNLTVIYLWFIFRFSCSIANYFVCYLEIPATLYFPFNSVSLRSKERTYNERGGGREGGEGEGRGGGREGRGKGGELLIRC